MSGRRNAREALDQGELVNNLAALILDMLLRIFEVLVGRVLGKSDLFTKDQT